MTGLAAARRRVHLAIFALTLSLPIPAMAEYYTQLWSSNHSTPDDAMSECERKLAEPSLSGSSNSGYTPGKCHFGWTSSNEPAVMVRTEWDSDYYGRVFGTGYDYFQEQPAEDLGQSCPVHMDSPLAQLLGQSCGNPINSANGNKFQVESDYVGPGLLQFNRYFNSLSIAPMGSTGVRWTSSFSQRIVSDPAGMYGRVLMRRPDGRVTEFAGDFGVTGYYVSAAHPDALLKRLVSGGSLTGWTYTENGGLEVEYYDAQGRLTSITRADGSSATVSYDSGSMLPASVIGQDGRRLDFTYTDAKLTKIVDSAGAETSYQYDSANRLTMVTYPGNTSKTYLYGEAAHIANSPVADPSVLTGIVDEKGQRFATFDYDDDHIAWATEHAGGVERHEVTFNPDKTVATVKYPAGITQSRNIVRVNGIARLSNISMTTDGATRNFSYTYDSNGNVDVVTDPSNTTTDYDVSSRGLITQVVEAANQPTAKRTTQTDWHSSFGVPTERRVLNAAGVLEEKSVWTYNARGQVLASSLVNLADALLSRTSTYTYCEQADVSAGNCPSIGLLLTIDGPRTDVVDITTYTYRQADEPSCASAPSTCPYRKGDLWKVANAIGQVTETLKYDGAGRPISVKDPNGIVTDLEYSPRGWLTARKVRGSDNGSEADDAIFRIDYDVTGAVAKVTEPDGAFISFTYDSAHRLTDVADALGNSIHYTLNNAGDRIQEDTKNSGAVIKRTLSRVYDTLGQLQTTADASSTPTDYAYDINGNLNITTDALLRVTDQDFDALGRVQQVISNTNGGVSDKATTQFQYDARDNLQTVIDPKGLSTSYTYDSLGNLTELSSPDTGSTIYSYDLAGNRTGEMKADNVSQGNVYDALGRLTGQTFAHSGQNVSLTYDTTQTDCATGETFSIGRLTKIANDSGSTRFCYDARGHRVRQIQTVALGTTLTTAPTYDSADHLVAMTYPSGAIVTYLRNEAGQITRIDAVPSVGAAQVTLVSNASYLPFGPLTTLEFGSGHKLAKTYDQNYRIDGVYDSSASNPLSQDFTVDPVGNITRIDELKYNGSLTTRSYSYDGLDRLTAQQGAIGGTIIESFTYDATGNRLSKNGDAYTYEPTSHHLVAVAGSAGGARSYNATGEAVSLASGATTKTFTYDDRHRLATVLVNGTLKLTNIYNALGQRVAKQPALASNLTQFVYDDSGHLIGEYTKTGARIKEYVWLDDTLVAVLSNHDGSTYQYIETDHLGTPRAIHPYTDATIWRWNINTSAFGEDAASDDPDANSIKYTLNLRFPGQYFDTETGLNYNYFRDYDPATGRYIESDPIGLRGGMNTYLYADANPFSVIDPLGLTSLWFDRDRGQLLVVPTNGKSYVIRDASSGRNNCGCTERDSYRGPIPHGRYVVDRDNLTNPGLLGDLARNILADWGDWRVPLRPVKGTNTFGRDKMFLHGGRMKGSAGCVDVGGGLFGNDQTDRLLKDILSDSDGLIPLYVK